MERRYFIMVIMEGNQDLIVGMSCLETHPRGMTINSHFQAFSLKV